MLVEIELVYKLQASSEVYTIYDNETTDVLLNVPLNHGNKDGSVVKTHLCLTTNRIRVDTAGDEYWSSDSYINSRTVMKDGAKEMIGRIHRDSIVGSPNPYIISTQYPIKSGEEWYYKNGRSTCKLGFRIGRRMETEFGIPASSNRIQLYKKNFSIQSLTNVTSFTMNVKYRYGMIVMLNGHEVFQNAIESDLSSESSSSNSYTDNLFHLIFM